MPDKPRRSVEARDPTQAPGGETMTRALAVPEAIESLGMRRSFLEDLALKTLFMHTELTLVELADLMRISISIVEDLFQRLRKEELCEVKGMAGGVYRIAITTRGRIRAQELLLLSQYVGPTPVSLADYVRHVRAQSVRNSEVRPPEVERALASVVLSEGTLKQLGTAVISGTSMFLYGPPGTGKTTIAEALPKIYNDHVWIPHAVEVDAQVISVYDAGVHTKADLAVSGDTDGRWLLCHRPRVISGGELTIEMLDLQYNPSTRFYSAPLQMKANNGVLIIDDFGRQRIRPEELLNRWIVPLDRGIDFLTLAGGKKFEIPFDLLVVFATNLEPAHLADEAFLRRIQNKIKVDSVTREQFKEIFRRVCETYQVEYHEGAAEEVIELLIRDWKQPLRPCYPRDLVQQICWAARYEGTVPKLDRTTLSRACSNYFLPP